MRYAAKRLAVINPSERTRRRALMSNAMGAFYPRKAGAGMVAGRARHCESRFAMASVFQSTARVGVPPSGGSQAAGVTNAKRRPPSAAGERPCASLFPQPLGHLKFVSSLARAYGSQDSN